VRVPALEDECGLEAAQLLAQLTGSGRRLEARIETRIPASGRRHAPSSAPTMTVSLRDAEDKELSISARMLRAGLARLSGKTQAATVLRPHMEEARAARRGIFEFGDPDDSDDERFPAATGRGRGRA
jgi:staphylococcal nuclease domain-containing protein 1